MSGVLRPVGPEPARTYWIRRALVIGTVVALVLIVVLAVQTLTRPEPTSAVPPADSPTPSASPEPSATPEPSSTPKSSATPSGTPSGSAGPKPPTSPKPTPSGSASASSSPSPTPTKPVEVAACEADDLRVTLIGKRTVRAQQDSTYDLSVINGGAAPCKITIDLDSFEFTITSGTDPIWSSDHCEQSLKSVSKTLDSQESLPWKMTWDGERSREDCKISSETPRPGIYWATATVEGVEPVRWRMTVTS